MRACLAMIAAALVLSVPVTVSAGDEHDYGLTAEAVADNVYAVIGSTEHFTMRNGGNIANCGFIITTEGALVIDTGPTALYGEQLRALVERIGGKPIVRVYNTHHHPDHFLGNQAFSDVPIVALAGTRRAMVEQAEAFSDNLYRLLGTWMKGTVPHLPASDLRPGVETIGGRRIETFALGGHTTEDLVLLDQQSGVMFAGDLVFNARAPTTPNADIDAWLAALETLAAIPFEYLVPGHGPVTRRRDAIAQTADYLRWLGGRIDDAVIGGRSMAETLYLPVPPRFNDMDTLTEEYRRSVMHVFPDVEHAFFHAAEEDR